MAPDVKEARTFTLVIPVAHSASADRQLAAALRRLRADEATVTKLTGRMRASTSS